MNILEKTRQTIATKLADLTYQYLPYGGGHKYFLDEINAESALGKSFDGNQTYGTIDPDKLINIGFGINPDVYAITNKIYETASDINLVLYRKTSEGKERVEEGAFFDFLQNPNDLQTMKELRVQAYGNILLTGNMYLYGEDLPGFGSAISFLEVLPSNCVELIHSGQVLSRYDYKINNTIRKLEPSTVWHGRYFNPTKDGIESGLGMSPLQAGFRSLTASNELVQAEASYYSNKGVSGILTSRTDKQVGAKETELIQKSVNSRLGGANKAGGVAATNASLTYEPIGMSPQDLQMIKSHNIKLRTLCRVFGVDSSIFGDTDNKTFSNRSEAEKSLYTNVSIPLNNRFISYLMRFIVPSWNIEDGADYILEQDLAGVSALAEDQTKQAERNLLTTEGILKVTESNLSDAAKVLLLVKDHKITREDAEILIQTQPTNEPGNE